MAGQVVGARTIIGVRGRVGTETLLLTHFIREGEISVSTYSSFQTSLGVALWELEDQPPVRSVGGKDRKEYHIFARVYLSR